MTTEEQERFVARLFVKYAEFVLRELDALKKDIESGVRMEFEKKDLLHDDICACIEIAKGNKPKDSIK